MEQLIAWAGGLAGLLAIAAVIVDQIVRRTPSKKDDALFDGVRETIEKVVEIARDERERGDQ